MGYHLSKANSLSLEFLLDYSILFNSSMVLNKMIPQRLLTMSRMTNPAITNCRTSLPRTAVKSAALSNQTSLNNLAPDPGDDGVFRRYLHRQSAVASSASRFVPAGGKLMERLREMDISRDRIRLDGLRPPPLSEETTEENLTTVDAKKILRLSQLEKVKTKLRRLEKDFVSHPEFLDICAKECSSPELGYEFAKILDDSGSVIVLGNTVFLRPEQVMKVVRGLIPLPPKPDDPRRKELQELEKQKAVIDHKAESHVRRELWVGLGYLVVQTAAFMRLTFWELSWDVMEPICFYVTSIYFMGGYAFFLRTSKEPSFEGFFQSRFSAKQKRLMKGLDFDVERYSELKRACDPHHRETAISCAAPTGRD